jgi:hypothetical protein
LPESAKAESMITTGICASHAFFTAGTSASGSDAASTIPATFRFTAFSTMFTSAAMSDSAAGPWKVIV